MARKKLPGNHAGKHFFKNTAAFLAVSSNPPIINIFNELVLWCLIRSSTKSMPVILCILYPLSLAAKINPVPSAKDMSASLSAFTNELFRDASTRISGFGVTTNVGLLVLELKILPAQPIASFISKTLILTFAKDIFLIEYTES